MYNKILFLISSEWFEKWKKFVLYDMFEKNAKKAEILINMKKTINYSINMDNYPNKIINEILMVGENNNLLSLRDFPILKNSLENKKDFILLPKESFELFASEFKYDYLIKTRLIYDRENNNKVYSLKSNLFNLILIPSKDEIIRGFKLEFFQVYIPELITEKDIYQFFIDLFNDNRYNIKLKIPLFFEENKIFIYLLLDSIEINQFRVFFENNIEEIKQGKRIDIHNYMKKISNYFQIKQLMYNTIIIQFDENQIFKKNILTCIDIKKLEYETNFEKNSLKNTTEISLLKVNDLLYQQNLFSDFNLKDFSFSSIHLKTQSLMTIENSYSSFINDLSDIETITYDYSQNERSERDTEESEENESHKNENIERENKQNLQIKGLVGLNNLGNTCYMNTSIQCLSNCDILTNFFLNDNYITNNNNHNGEILVNAYKEILIGLWKKNIKNFEPLLFKKLIGQMNSTFRNNEQHDANDFLIFLLNGLKDGLNIIINQNDYNNNESIDFKDEIEEYLFFKKNYLSKEQSIIIDLFYGTFKSSLYCLNPDCKYISNKFENFTTISLPLTINYSPNNIKVYFIYEISTIIFICQIFDTMSIKNFREKINYLLKIGIFTFEIYFENDKKEYILIDESKYKNMGELLGNNKKIFLFQIPRITFGKDNTDENLIKDILDDHSLIYKREKEFDNSKIVNENIEESFNKEEWIKCIIYHYSYKNDNNKNKDKYLPKDYLNYLNIIYINKGWTNKELFQYIIKYYKSFYSPPDQKFESFFENYEKTIEKYINKKDFKLTYSLNKKLSYPFIIFFIGTSLIYKEDKNINDLIEEENGDLFSIKESKKTIKEILQNIKLKENETVKDYQFIFKLVWNPDFIQRFKNNLSSIKIENTTITFDLMNLLNNFIQKEILSEENNWICPKCKKNKSSEKKIDIFTCSEILIIQLKRNNLSNLVKFPIENLNIGEYVQYKENKQENYLYDLFAVANHKGSLDQGHYYAYCKNKENKKWYEFNDKNVKEIEEKNIITSQAYILFYKKKQSLFPDIDKLYSKYQKNN
jgi:ubiquitin carboxyl-terminal hydrolase 4/11/15